VRNIEKIVKASIRHGKPDPEHRRSNPRTAFATPIELADGPSMRQVVSPVSGWREVFLLLFASGLDDTIECAEFVHNFRHSSRILDSKRGSCRDGYFGRFREMSRRGWCFSWSDFREQESQKAEVTRHSLVHQLRHQSLQLRDRPSTPVLNDTPACSALRRGECSYFSNPLGAPWDCRICPP